MTSPRRLSFFLAIVVGLVAALPARVHADDTEIYLGSQSLRQGVRPNIMFIIDTSGSMASYDGTTESRLTRMQTAMDSLLGSLNNVNVGLMRFTVPGGPVLYPIANLDADASTIDNAGHPDVSVPITSADDDAEQLISTGDVSLNSAVLELGKTPAFYNEHTIGPISVSNSYDDAYAYVGYPYNVTNSSALYVPNYYGLVNTITGIRFPNVPIPSGAQIIVANMQLQSQQNYAGNTQIDFRAETNPAAPDYSGSSPQSRTTVTNAVTHWTPAELLAGDFHPTPDLSNIIQEVVNDAGAYTGGINLSFILSSGLSSSNYDQHREFSSYDTNSNGRSAPQLNVTYASGPGGEQLVALHFRDVRIPQGVTITSANIQFVPAASDSSPAQFTIYGDASDNSAPLAATLDDISNRTHTNSSVTWSAGAWPDPAEQQASPQLSADISSVIQDIVDRPNWCGGNDITIIIKPTGVDGPRRAFSYDSNPSRAPVLRVNFDKNTPLGPGQGCTTEVIQRQIQAGSDDAEERNNNVNIGGSNLHIYNGRTAGFVFRNITIAPGAQVVSATLGVTAYRDDSTGGVDWSIHGQRVPDAPSFTSTSSNISSRALTNSSVTWSGVPAFTRGVSYNSPDLSSIVAEIINQAGWASGNNMAFIVTADSGYRRVETLDDNPALAATLKIRVRTSLGNETTNSIVTVRDRLKTLVDSLNPLGSTPIVDTLYEAALYFRGEPVLYGLNRGSGSTNTRALNRVSHPGSYTGGFDVLPSGCTADNLNATACADEHISGSPVYTSPITDACQANYIVLLTDGEANVNNSTNLIKSMTGQGNCDTSFNAVDPATGTSTTYSVNSGEMCGLDLVHYLYNNDQAPNVSGKNNIATYTIGFNFSGAWLKQLAYEGGGSYYTATSSSDLTNVFKAIVTSILSRTTSFASPSLSVNAFNKLFNRNDVYFSLFKPSNNVRWDGNVKKYQLCQSSSNGCTPGTILDASTPPQPAIGSDQRISDSALSFWTAPAPADGASILKGGAGNQIPSYTTRNVYTYIEGTTSSPADPSLAATRNQIVGSNTLITKTMLGGSSSTSSPLYMSDAERSSLIQWIRGQDVDDENANGVTNENRYAFADPLHSSPVAVTYGGSESNPVDKLFVGTNDGALHMINAETGKEEWAFYPPSMLANQRELRADPYGNHIYGMDGSPTVWVHDTNNDGIIQPDPSPEHGDFVHVYIGERRGGNEIWALDVTPSTTLTDPVNSTITPKMMWHITGGTADFASLGLTFSRPRYTTIRYAEPDGNGGYTTTTKDVLIFAGGYDTAQDGNGTITSGGLGNAIYIVDAQTGQRIAYATSPAAVALHSTSGSGVENNDYVAVPNMIYPIPSDVALMDSNGDGSTDRVYVGDTGGQLWRMDILPDTTNGGVKLIVGELATVSKLNSKWNTRKFFYPPDVVQVRGSQYSSPTHSDYDLVTIVTGNRAHPLDLTVQDRFYAFNDYTIGHLTDSNGDGLADGYPVVVNSSASGGVTTGTPIQGPIDPDNGPSVCDSSSSDLVCVDTMLNFDPATSSGAANLAVMQTKNGYYLNFGSPVDPNAAPATDTGEKGLASPIVLAGKVFFTTYLPNGVVSGQTCTVTEGNGRLYGINVLNGAPVFNWDESTPGATSRSDRIYTLGAGIPSSAVPIFQPEQVTLLVGGGGGATTINPNIQLPRKRTYWLQQSR